MIDFLDHENPYFDTKLHYIDRIFEIKIDLFFHYPFSCSLRGGLENLIILSQLMKIKTSSYEKTLFFTVEKLHLLLSTPSNLQIFNATKRVLYGLPSRVLIQDSVHAVPNSL